MTKEQLGELLNAKLPRNASRAELHEYIRNQQELVVYLAHSLAVQGRSILEIRDMLIEPSIEPAASGLVGFEEPKVII
jgi:hypothetical protein